VDEAGEYFLIDPKSGAVLSSDLWNKRIFSDLVIARDWMIGAGVDGFHGRSLKNHSVEFSSVLQDPLIRKVISHPNGFLTGDDTGKIRFWEFGQLRIR
jgi:hypothetical protein